jgi:F-type H+-transporting ATPase subunit gamma
MMCSSCLFAHGTKLLQTLYNAMLENNCSEHASRMSAMENSTKSAGEILQRLTLQYNRDRQASITNELIEIISGAAALTDAD